MKKIICIVLAMFLSVSLMACQDKEPVIGGTDEEIDIVITDEPQETVYTEDDLDNLKNTDNFLPSAIEHIFLGQVNKKGAATGYHYDGIEDSPGYILEGTKSDTDANGVYSAKVEVDGVAKTGNGGYSSFYPESLSPQEVIDAINEAYESKEHIRSNTYRGDTSFGFVVEMYLSDDDLIISAFPIYEE